MKASGTSGKQWFFATVTLRRLEDGNHVDVRARVDVLIDFDELFRILGNKALDNKSKRTRALNGMITAEAHRAEKPDAGR